MAINDQLIQNLREKQKKARLGGGEEKIAKRHDKGQLTARERLDLLFDEHTFVESGMHVDHDCHEFGMEKKSFVGDGVVTGIGNIANKTVAAFSQDFTVGGGALGRRHSEKIVDLMNKAQNYGVPVIAINDSGGARIQEGVESLSGYGRVFHKNVDLSGLVPQIAVISGPCAGGAAYSPALMDFIIMVRSSSKMFICGPDVIKAVTGQQTTMAEIGSAEAHAAVSGNIHFIAEDDQHAMEIVKKLVGFLPSNNVQDPPHDLSREIILKDDEEISKLIPEDSKRPIDIHKVIFRVVDDEDFLEVQAEWARSIVVGFGSVQGVKVGIVANHSGVKAGTLDIDASDKAARFIRFCNAFNIPIVTLVDVPGFLPGVNQERNGIIRHGAKMLFAYASATVPKVTVILRKAYGGAYLAMCSKDMGADAVFAWPTAEIAVMGAEGAVTVLYGRELKKAENADELKQKYIKEYQDRFASPYLAASKGMITDVIEPSQTKRIISLSLRNALSKSLVRPPKKHGLIPL